MAEGNSSEQMLLETQQEPEECAICCTDLKDPRLLDCSHSFCMTCLQELQASQNDGNNIACPVCRRKTALPEGGVEILPRRHQKVQDVLQALVCQELKVLCQACDEENEAVSRCIDCEHYLCVECQKAHERLAKLMIHNIVSLRELESKNIQIPNKQPKDNIPMCENHPDQNLCFYCNSCDVLICKTCTEFEHKKSMHSFYSIDQAFRKCKQEIDLAISTTRVCIQNFISANPVSLRHSRNRLDTTLTRTNMQISLKAAKEIAKIREKEKHLKMRAKRTATKRDKEFAYATTAEQTLSKVNKVMTTAGCYEILESKRKLLNDLETQGKIHKSLDISHGKSFLGFKEGYTDGDIGSLLEEERWTLQDTFKRDGVKYIAVYSTGDVAMADSNGITIMDLEGKEIFDHDSDDLLSTENPTAVAVNTNDQLIVLDGTTVKIFDEEYELLDDFIPGSKSVPTCVAVDDNNQIAVGYKEKEEISLHDADGSLISTLPAPMIDQHLTMSNQQLIYTNTNRNILTAVDLNGKQIFRVKTNGSPSGVCCDESGDIYVAVYSQTAEMTKVKNGFRQSQVHGTTNYTHIQHYSTDGKLTATWQAYTHTDWRMDTSADISFTPNGKLVVAETGKRIRIYQHY